MVGVKPYQSSWYLVLPSYPHRTPDTGRGGRGGEVGPDPRLIITHCAALAPSVSLSVGLWFFRAFFFFFVFCCSLTHEGGSCSHAHVILVSWWQVAPFLFSSSNRLLRLRLRLQGALLQGSFFSPFTNGVVLSRFPCSPDHLTFLYQLMYRGPSRCEEYRCKLRANTV